MAERKHAELIKQWADDDSLQIEMKNIDGEWVDSMSPCFLDQVEYRIKPTKPSIDWSHVADEYRWLAKDEDGTGWLFDQMPTIAHSFWMIEIGKAVECEQFKSLKYGTCDWKDSLVQRPAKDSEE